MSLYRWNGSCAPIYPGTRPVTAEDEAAGMKALAPEDDKEWHELVKNGGAGDAPDTPEAQQVRYGNLTTVENNPGAAEYQFRDPDILITCSLDYLLKTWDCKDNFRLLQTFEGHVGQVHQAEPYRHDMILSAGDDLTVRLWKRGTSEYGELLFTYWTHSFPMKCLVGLPGMRFGVGGLDKIFRVVCMVTGHTLHRFEDHQLNGPDNNYFQKEGCGSVWCLMHLRTNIVLSASDDATIRFWDIDEGKQLSTTIGHQGWGRDIGRLGWGLKLSETFAAIWRLIHLGDGGNTFASCSYDRTIAIWDATDIYKPVRLRMWKSHENAVLNISVLDKDHLISVGSDKEVKVWNWRKAKVVSMTEQTRGIAAQAMRVTADTFAIAGGDTTIRVWNWRTEEHVIGERGFNAHDFIITNMSKIFLEDDDESKWTKDPIMYRTCTVEKSNEDAQSAIMIQRNSLQDALTFEEFD